jgi:hypothetical protein
MRLIRIAILGPLLIGLLGVFTPTHALAQTPVWNTPSSGYLYDSFTQSIRSIVGFAGSAYLGSSAASGVDWASLAPNQQSALVISSGGALLSIANLAAPSQVVSLDPTYTPRQVLWSADSSQAVLLTAGGQLVWLTNMAATPLPVASWDLETRRPTRSLPRQWSLLAADSAADRVLLTSRGDDSSELWWASTSVSPVIIPLTGQAGAAVFSSSASAFVVDGAAHSIFQIQNLPAGPTVSTLLSSEQYLTKPIGMALSADGTRIFVADGGGQTVRSFDAGSGTLQSEMPFGSNAVSMTRVSPSRFLLNPPVGTGQPLFFLDTGQPARVFFIPRGAQ